MNIPIDALRNADLFAGLTVEQIKAVANLGERLTYHEGETIVKADTPGNELYIVLSGQVEVSCDNEEICYPPLVVLGAGQGFGEMSMIDSGPRSATIMCVSETAELLRIAGEPLLAFCQEDRVVGYQIIYNLARDLAFKLRHRNLTRPNL
ncbi:MAG: cyclic nucleotide-binding domain-containing protein [Anaerolineae bacterium]|nr:cyclic nucleotide-binding domain-containing protein [Anaerolineae bacterium]